LNFDFFGFLVAKFGPLKKKKSPRFSIVCQHVAKNIKDA
jgi:hypothetical protein